MISMYKKYIQFQIPVFWFKTDQMDLYSTNEAEN